MRRSNRPSSAYAAPAETTPRACDGSPIRSGTPTAAEWDGFWTSLPGESLPTEQEFERDAARLAAYLRRVCEIAPGPRQQCYLQGDFFGDRSHTLVWVDERALTVSTLRAMQRLLREPRLRHSRIMIPTSGRPHDFIIVYPTAIRVGGAPPATLGARLAAIRSRMRRAAREEETAQLRICDARAARAARRGHGRPVVSRQRGRDGGIAPPRDGEFRKALLKIKRGMKKECQVADHNGPECELINENCGDRTLRLRPIAPRIVSVPFLRALQRILRDAGMEGWRIVVRTESDRDAMLIVVSASAIQVGGRTPKNLGREVAMIRNRMIVLHRLQATSRQVGSAWGFLRKIQRAGTSRRTRR